MTKTRPNGKMKKINVVIDGKREYLSFNKIANLAQSKGVPTFFNMGDKVGSFSMSRDINDFATKFTVLFYPDFITKTFKINIQHDGVWFWEVPTLTKKQLFNLTSPVL